MRELNQVEVNDVAAGTFAGDVSMLVAGSWVSGVAGFAIGGPLGAGIGVSLSIAIGVGYLLAQQ